VASPLWVPRSIGTKTPRIEHHALLVDLELQIVDQKRGNSFRPLALQIEGMIALAVYESRSDVSPLITDDELHDHGPPTKLKW